jgi:hypothetical protein
MKRPEVRDLQDALKLLIERGALVANDEAARQEMSEALKAERAQQAYGTATAKLVSSFQLERQLPATGGVDEQTAKALNAWLTEPAAYVPTAAHAPAAAYQIQGRVTSRVSASVGNLRVLVVDKCVGSDVRLAEAVTDSLGNYRASFSDAAFRRRGKEKPDLQARVFSGGRPIASSEVRYDASTQETMNVLLDDKVSRSLRSEHETLTAALAVHYKGSLGELEETGERQDVTYLANKSGWDARAVALAALAEQFRARTVSGRDKAGIEAPFFYALFRAGVPASDAAVYRMDPKAAEAIWTRAIRQGVIPAALRDRLPAAVQQFQQLAARQLLEGPALAGVSSFKELLTLSLRDDTKGQQQFADLYVRYGTDPARFWKAVRAAFGTATTDRLKLDGQLGCLTLNNRKLIEKLHAAVGNRGLRDPVQLVAAGYYQSATWRKVLDSDPVPPEIPGKDSAQKRERYAELLAAQVRLSFPTAVLAAMVKSGETPLHSAKVRNAVAAFLSQHQGRFQIGMQPVAQYVARNNLRVAAEVAKEITRIQRVYQITPDDTAMNGLLRSRIDSAYAVVRYDREEFVRAFKDAVGGERNARVTHAKAQQVHAAVLNVALTFLTGRSAPRIGAHSPGAIIDATPSAPANAADVLSQATLESLFGEMDYCTCEECRSILSPAAYLVDLLLFIDRPATEVPDGFRNPLTQLLDRRPDIQHLPLTCENTNTPLPYIDLVNETLEYYIVNGLSLVEYKGHTTDGTATPEELLATPQFVKEAVYTALAGEEEFPPPLPVCQPLENLRRHFRRFDAPLPRVMEDLRKDDRMERGSAADYGWRDIWMETLGLSRAEHRLLTERWLTGDATDVMTTVRRLYGFDQNVTDAKVRTVLDHAVLFCRRVGISYVQLAEILRTRSVNPDARITLTNPADPDDQCNFDQVELRYSNRGASPTKLRPFEFVRLIRFIRLWKKLGWSIEQTDKAITALYPIAQMPNDPSDAVNLERLDAGFLQLLPSLSVVKRVLDVLGLSLKRDLPPLLACMAPIETSGESSLYRQMFLGPAQPDRAFAGDGSGNYLTDPNEHLLDHAGALRAAFSLTAGEFGEITGALGYDASTALTLDNISDVFRRGWLARKLKLSVRECLRLARLTGYDPFQTPDPVGPAMLRLVEFVGRLRALGIKPVQALYLIWNQDLSGKSAPTEAEITAFARSVRAALVAIEGEYARVDDPDGSIARARMALVYGHEAADLFFSFLDNTFASAADYSHAQPTLEGPILDAAPGRIAYDDFRKRLSFAGVMSSSVRDALKAVSGVSTAFQDAVDSLYVENQMVVGPFFARYSDDLLALYDAYQNSPLPVDEKRAVLLNGLMKDLKEKRKRQQALQSASAAAKGDVGLASSLLDDARVLHKAMDASRPALDDLAAPETPGLAVQYFYAATATGNPNLVPDAPANLEYAPAGTKALPSNTTTPGAAISGVWSGYVEAPENSLYNIRIDADPLAKVRLIKDGRDVALAQAGGSWTNTVPIELRVGTLYAISLTVENVKDNLAVSWRTAGHGWEVIPAAYLYSATLMDGLRQAYVRFLKAAALAAALKLTAAETACLAAHADYQIGGVGWLNALPVAGDPNAATASALFSALVGALDFSRMKKELSPGDERLLEVLRDPGAATAEATSLLYVLTRWDKAYLDSLLARFYPTGADLSHVETLRRVFDAYGWLTKLGVSAEALIEATTNEPTADVVRDLQAALRARYDEASWLDVLKPINDEMRTLQRDALVAHTLHAMGANRESAHINTPDKLFEYFLMDVEMDPCMLTSRIRHALSTVQLFIERCLMNLENHVSPASIKAKQWEWMKRYRVWEANRKVFLYPENWLEPELRDDQSSFFKEVMSELLQGDITEERAAEALVDYLTKLEEVAKLEICGIHLEESQPGMADEIAHVVARTAGAKRKYFYRRRESSVWTPWEKVTLDIEDNPVLPVVWKNRRFLFWLKLTQETLPLDPPSPSGTDGSVQLSDILPRPAPRLVVKAILCWSEYLMGKWQPARTSDPANPLYLGTFDLQGSKASDRSNLRLSALFWAGGGLRIIVSTQVGTGSSFFLYNAFSTPELRDQKKVTHFSPKRLLDTSTASLAVTYSGTGISHAVLDNGIADRAVDPHHPISGNAWDPPFFYEDSRHVFYVSTTERLVTVPEWNDFGVVPRTQNPTAEIPGLVLKPDKPLVFGPTISVTQQPGFGVVDPSPVGAYVTEDAYIRMAIGTRGTVRYGDKAIGPSGNQIRTRPVR